MESANLTPSLRFAVRVALARLRRQTRESGYTPARTSAGRARERRIAINTLGSEHVQALVAETPPPLLRTLWCKVCSAYTQQRGDICQSHFHRNCELCGRGITVWKNDKCSEHTVARCSQCKADTPQRDGKCLSSAHPKTATTTRWCDTCDASTAHVSGKCTEHKMTYCEACKTGTNFRAGKCTEHTTGWCDSCGTNTPQQRDWPYSCMAPDHGKPAAPAASASSTGGETRHCPECNCDRPVSGLGFCRACGHNFYSDQD